MDKIFEGHIKDLSARAEKSGRFTFTSFLSPDEQSAVIAMKREIGCFEFFGGADMTERNIARFGDKDALGWEQDYPIKIIKITPVNEKFSDDLTHRDYLGALMNLGIERCEIGDIAVKSGGAFIFVTDKMAGYICDNLSKVKHTNVKCECVDFAPEGELYTLEERTVIVSSVRIDCIVAAVFNLPRGKAQEMIELQRVFINGAAVSSTSKETAENDRVSVRGYGKFVMHGVEGMTKKGRSVVRVGVYK